jgi:hypothetical protein
MGGSYLWAYLNCPFEIIDTGDISLFMFSKSHVNERKFVVGAKTFLENGRGKKMLMQILAYLLCK